MHKPNVVYNLDLDNPVMEEELKWRVENNIDGKMTFIKNLQKYCQDPSVGIDRDIINKIDHLKDLLR